MGKGRPKDLKSHIGTDTQLHTDAAQPSDLDFQQMSHGSSRPVRKWICINNSLLPFLSNHYSCLCNIKKLQRSAPYATILHEDKEMDVYPTSLFSRSYNCEYFL